MTVNELKIALNGEMEWAKELLSDIDGIEYTAEVEGAEESSYTFGVVMLGTEEMTEDERIYISLEADINDDDTVDEADFNEQVQAFRTGLCDIAALLRGSDDKRTALLEIGSKIDEELDRAYAAEMEKINRETSERHWIAIGATAVILIVAAVCIAVKLITKA